MKIKMLLRKSGITAAAALAMALALGAQEVKAPGIVPPAAWLQKYSLAMSKNADLAKLQSDVQALFTQLRDEMSKPSKDCPYGCSLDVSTMTWIPNPKPKAEGK